MSTQINVTVGDQRLLQANKTRAAANQQNLDDRLTENKTVAALEPELEKKRQEEEQPGSIPVRRIPRRPAAQRTETFKYGITLIKDLQLIEENVQQIIGEPWFYYAGFSQGTASDALFWAGQVPVSLENRRVTYTTDSIKPYVYQSTPQFITAEIAPVFTATQTINIFESPISLRFFTSQTSWYTVVRSTIKEGTRVNFQENVRDVRYVTYGPPWPITLNPYTLNTLNLVVVSSTSTETYISCLHSYYILTMKDRDALPSFSGVVIPSESSLSEMIIAGARTLIQARYVQINNKTQQITQQYATLADYISYTRYANGVTGNAPFFSIPVAGTYYPDFIQNMFSGDPRKEIYTATSRTDWALDPYISNSTYDPESGSCVVAAKDKSNETIFVFSRTLDKNLPYAQVLIDTARPVAQFISTNTAATVANSTPQNFKLVTQFQNVYGSTVYTSPYAGEQT